jgi:hypothetical protein
MPTILIPKTVCPEENISYVITESPQAPQAVHTRCAVLRGRNCSQRFGTSALETILSDLTEDLILHCFIYRPNGAGFLGRVLFTSKPPYGSKTHIIPQTVRSPQTIRSSQILSRLRRHVTHNLKSHSCNSCVRLGYIVPPRNFMQE